MFSPCFACSIDSNCALSLGWIRNASARAESSVIICAAVAGSSATVCLRTLGWLLSVESGSTTLGSDLERSATIRSTSASLMASCCFLPRQPEASSVENSRKRKAHKLRQPNTTGGLSRNPLWKSIRTAKKPPTSSYRQGVASAITQVGTIGKLNM